MIPYIFFTHFFILSQTCKQLLGMCLRCSGEQVGETSQGDGGNKVGEKMEKAKMKRKNKLGMWGNAIIINPPQEDKVDPEPEFRFNKKTE